MWCVVVVPTIKDTPSVSRVAPVMQLMMGRHVPMDMTTRGPAPVCRASKNLPHQPRRRNTESESIILAHMNVTAHQRANSLMMLDTFPVGHAVAAVPP